jgi:competence protein ComEC
MRRLVLAAFIPIWCAAPRALAAQDDTLWIRVADVGAGLCTIARVPGGAVMVYDAGHWLGGRCIVAVQAVLPPGDTIDLLVLSHSDSDHLGDAPAILGQYTVRRIIWTGFRRPGVNTWEQTNRAIAEEVLTEGASVRSLATHPLTVPDTIALGPATVTLLAGWSRWTLSTGLSEAERRNVVSVVVRLDYGEASVLYGGDTVGRRIGDAAGACKDAEAWMVGNHAAARATLRADVLIAPHHGADNGSSQCFIQAVQPEWVIFSAGHDFEHPRAATVARFLAAGVALARLLRTDRGDDEGPAEWAEGRVAGCTDPRGDDDLEIRLHPGGTVRVAYVTAFSGC